MEGNIHIKGLTASAGIHQGGWGSGEVELGLALLRHEEMWT